MKQVVLWVVAILASSVLLCTAIPPNHATNPDPCGAHFAKNYKMVCISNQLQQKWWPRIPRACRDLIYCMCKWLPAMIYNVSRSTQNYSLSYGTDYVNNWTVITCTLMTCVMLLVFRQYYSYVTDTQCTRVGTQCWLFWLVNIFVYHWLLVHFKLDDCKTLCCYFLLKVCGHEN